MQGFKKKKEKGFTIGLGKSFTMRKRFYIPQEILLFATNSFAMNIILPLKGILGDKNLIFFFRKLC